MAYDHQLAERLRTDLVDTAAFEEIAMFGGVVFMVNTHMACGVVGDDLMLRLTEDAAAAAVGRGATPMHMGGKSMRGMVLVAGAGLRDQALSGWVAAAVAHARSKPPQSPRKR